ncbi:MAG: translation elongation factor Ts [Saprospiraceae bacterium]|jgi:elongation factor Ts|nr:translation elongation factor Ts [Saprospiraceae bacterium]MDG1435533.1 translation elongation factor Ts [Saprospiraceae bacterium]MDG2418239.1 translation elongation factor Ts [Saprospiraceae bacterium]
MDVKISAKDVKELRDISGAGMMDCKKALTEAGGNIEDAIAILRKKGQKLSAKRADRDAKEGAVIALTSDNRNNGIIVRLSCETDFVGKGDAFIALANSIGEVALKNLPDSLEALLALPFDAEMNVGDKVTEQVGVFGEKVEVKAYEKVVTAAGAGQVLPYIHMGNRAAVLVALNLEGPDYVEPGKNVAMQVAAMKPLGLNKDSIDPAVIEKEMEINMDQARQLGKPEAMLEKIASGKMNKFFKENTLMAQVYVKDGSMTVESYLKSANKELTVTEFKHVALG